MEVGAGHHEVSVRLLQETLYRHSTSSYVLWSVPLPQLCELYVSKNTTITLDSMLQ